MFNLIKESFKPKHLKKASLLLVLMLFLTFSGCSFNNQSSLTASSQVSATSSLAVSTNLNSQDQVSLVAIEVNKLPTRLDYSPNEVVTTSGGELRVAYSDYSIRYISMRDSMIETNRLNISTLGNSSVTLKYQEGSIAKYITYKVNIVPFVINVNSVALDIVSSDVLRTQSVQLNPIITPLNGLVRDIKWSSSNPLIARVDNNGLVTPINPGEVIITVTVNNLYSAASRLNIINDEPEGLEQTEQESSVPTLTIINSLILDTIVTAPSSGATPVVAPIDQTQFEGTIAWFESNGTTPLTGNFASAKVYVAKLNLVAKPNFTLDGVVANSFVYNGATSVTNSANSGLITITFPSQITQVNIATISGVTAPVTGATPVTTITQSDQFTGTITWSPAVASTFAPATVYTATITLTAKSGFTFAGVTSNFFTVAGATASNTINSGTVTAIFTETNSTVVNIAAISGVTAPVTGATPVTTITQSDQFTGTITWSPAVASTFAPATVYTATITLTPKTGFTFIGVSANFFTVASATATNNINSGSVGAVFPTTNLITINLSSISGVPEPVGGQTPATTITETNQYTGTVTWSPNVASFVAGASYTATITLTPKTGFTLTGVIQNFFTVSGASSTNNTNSGIISALFLGSEVLNLDASKFDSYSGTGTTWTNLSNQSLNATITGSPTFNRNSGFTFNGTSSQYARVAHSNELTFTNQQSYSVEIWFNPAASQVSQTLATLVEKWNSANQSLYPYAVRYAENTGSLSFAAYDGSNNPTITSSGFGVNAWHHAIGVYDMQAQQLKMYHNGVELGAAVSLVSLGNISNTSSIGIGHRIGTSGEAQFVYKGQIGQIRIYNKALTNDDVLASYNSSKFNFFDNNSPAITSLGDGARVASDSPFASGGSSYAFSGDTAVINYAANADWAVGTGDFTIEWFSRQSSLTEYQRIFSLGDYPSIKIGVSIELGTFYYWANNSFRYSSSGASIVGVWIHWAVVRSAGFTKIYKNGVLLGSQITDNNDITANNITLTIGNTLTPASNAVIKGNITNFRWVKGTAVYTGNFTVPTGNLLMTPSANPYGGLNTVAIPAGHTKLLIIP
jgi:hypothetical protein